MQNEDHTLSLVVDNGSYEAVSLRKVADVLDPRRCPLCRMVVVAAGVQLKCGVDALAPVKFAEGFGIFLYRPEHRVPCFALPVTQREVDAVRLAQGCVGKYILPEPGKPERAGHAGRTGEHIGAIESIHREQSCQ